jgi:N-acetylmuramoyl-L-alanine amidase
MPRSPATPKLSSRSAARAALLIAVLTAGCGSGAASRRVHASPDGASTSARGVHASPVGASTSARGVHASPVGASTSARGVHASPVAASTSARRPPRAEVVSTAAVGRPAPSSSPRKPPIVWDPIPFGPLRKAQMVAYVHRHYGSFMNPTWRLIDPRVIVIHYTEASFSSTYNTFANDIPDSELHELPATCAHFVINTDGTIYQLVSLGTMCRHTVGLNWTAIGIEHVGYSDAQVLGDQRQISASLRLVRWLRCQFKIQIKNVIGHNESLSSPYHREDVVALRTQTHSDFDRHDMQIYRARLRQLGGC